MEDRGQGRAPRPLRHIPDGRGRRAEGTVRANPAADRRAATTTGSSVGPNEADALSPREGCVRMARERAKSMDQSSFWTVDAAGPPGKLASAAHGFRGTRQDASVHIVLSGHLQNVGLNQP